MNFDEEYTEVNAWFLRERPIPADSEWKRELCMNVFGLRFYPGGGEIAKEFPRPG
jgi:hypothetical protein